MKSNSEKFLLTACAFILWWRDSLRITLFVEKELGAGGGIRARDFWAPILGDCSPDHESGAIARLGYPGVVSLLF